MVTIASELVTCPASFLVMSSVFPLLNNVASAGRSTGCVHYPGCDNGVMVIALQSCTAMVMSVWVEFSVVALRVVRLFYSEQMFVSHTFSQ